MSSSSSLSSSSFYGKGMFAIKRNKQFVTFDSDLLHCFVYFRTSWKRRELLFRYTN